MSLALRHALFEDGLDISQPAVLSDLSDSLNIGPYGDADNEGVRREWEEGVRRGVRGSPHFYCGDVDAFCPSLDISRDADGVLTVRKDTAVLRAFSPTASEDRGRLSLVALPVDRDSGRDLDAVCCSAHSCTPSPVQRVE